MTTQKVTTHWEDIADLNASDPDLTVYDPRRWVDEGFVVASGGISAGIDRCLHLASSLHRFELAEKTVRQMEFYLTKKS